MANSCLDSRLGVMSPMATSKTTASDLKQILPCLVFFISIFFAVSHREHKPQSVCLQLAACRVI